MNLKNIEKKYKKYSRQLDDSGNTFLMYLVLNKKTNNFLDYINNYGRNIEYLNHVNNNGENLFLLLCKQKLEYEAILMLDIFTPNFNLIDNNGNTSILYMLKNNMKNLSKIVFSNYIDNIDLFYINNNDKYSSYMLYSFINKNTYILNIILNKLLNNLDKLYININIFRKYINEIENYIKKDDLDKYINVFNSLKKLYKKEKVNDLIIKYEKNLSINIPNELFSEIYDYTLSV